MQTAYVVYYVNCNYVSKFKRLMQISNLVGSDHAIKECILELLSIVNMALGTINEYSSDMLEEMAKMLMLNKNSLREILFKQLDYSTILVDDNKPLLLTIVHEDSEQHSETITIENDSEQDDNSDEETESNSEGTSQ